MITLVHDMMDGMHGRTMTTCKDSITTNDGQRPSLSRFQPSVLPWYLDQLSQPYDMRGLDDIPPRYIYATSTLGMPESWAGFPGTAQSDLFIHIPSAVLADMRAGNAIFMVDQCMEGFVDDRLYDWFHLRMHELDLPPMSICYVSSNLRESSRYIAWCQSKGEQAKLMVHGIWYLEAITRSLFMEQPMPDLDTHAKRKASGGAKLFNCLNRISRYHRNVMILELMRHGLMGRGLISMEEMSWPWHLANNGYGEIEQQAAISKMPLRIDLPGIHANPAMDINAEIYLDTYVSLITETNCGDGEVDMLITEKVWKSIYAGHPFMILGPRNVLRELQSQGYQTFDAFWDESYDSLEDLHQRAGSIARELQVLQRGDLLSLWHDLLPILDHNRRWFINKDIRCAGIRQVLRFLDDHCARGI